MLVLCKATYLVLLEHTEYPWFFFLSKIQIYGFNLNGLHVYTHFSLSFILFELLSESSQGPF